VDLFSLNPSEDNPEVFEEMSAPVVGAEHTNVVHEIFRSCQQELKKKQIFSKVYRISMFTEKHYKFKYGISFLLIHKKYRTHKLNDTFLNMFKNWYISRKHCS
jgi:hypothetical protein